MESVRKLFTNDRFGAHNGIDLLEVSDGRAKLSMEIRDYHKNAYDTVHGGAIFTLADLAFAVAANSHGRVAVAINAHISFMKAATGGTLFAEAEVVSANPKIGAYTVRVTDDGGDLIAIFQGMAYRKRDSISASPE